eukprot:TRINITY_DN14075_c0_g1_i1.p1 TRINITY_DN14075_c0_g1~~TRINITY_DN14075_c0_g1_i1.p1  ORF type:complete len:487 (-),score=78.25 TRINITY_DN14075_c0_g1_i1:96-1487(-)
MDALRMLWRKAEARSLLCFYCVFLVNQFVEIVHSMVAVPVFGTTVSCDVPLSPGVFSGSRSCGDREVVMRESFNLVFEWMFYEQMLTCLWAFVDVVLIDSVNRKTLLLAMLINDFVWQSMTVVYLAGFHASSWGKAFWYLGATIHAVTPTKLVMDALILDFCYGDLELTEVAATTKKVLVTLLRIVGPVVGMLVLRAEILDYSFIYVLCALSQVVGCIVVSFLDSSKLIARKPFAIKELGHRVLSAFALLQRSEIFWAVVQVGMLAAPMQVGIDTLAYAHTVTRLGWRQESHHQIGLLINFCVLPLTIASWAMARRFGFVRYWKVLRSIDVVQDTFGWLLIPFGSAAFVAKVIVGTAAAILKAPISDSVMMMLPLSAKDVRGEVLVLFRFFGGLCSAVSSKFFKHAFDSGAASYAGIVWPFTGVIGLKAIAEVVYWKKLWQVCKPVFKEMESCSSAPEAMKQD